MTTKPMSVQAQTDSYVADIRRYAGAALTESSCVGTAAILLGLIGNLERTIRREREEAFDRITALRLAIRDVLEEGESIYLREVLAADDASVGSFRPADAGGAR